MRILTGIQPTGAPHLGNYFAMMKPVIESQNVGESYIFIADYHTMTVTPDPKEFKENCLNLAIDFLACGLDPEKVVFYRQSDILQIPELAWILSCFTPLGLLERCHSYKDKIANGIIPNCGLFYYPILMAADILIYKSTSVPIGKDQKQHVEVTRDIAQRFNNKYGNVFILPEPIIKSQVATVIGTDGRKMSKSYGNTIPLFGNLKKIRKSFMKIVTDSKTPEESKDPENCSIFKLYQLFATDEQAKNMSERYRSGGLMYGVAKQELFELYNEYFEKMRARREELAAAPDYIEEVLEKGAKKASEVAEQTMNEVRSAIGIR